MVFYTSKNTPTKINFTPRSTQIKKNSPATYNNEIVASISSTALRTGPILIPNVCAIRHVFAADLLAKLFGGATFRDIVLFEGALWEVRLTTPSDFGQTHIFALFACFNCIQTLFSVLRLIGAHVTFQRGTYKPDIDMKSLTAPIKFTKRVNRSDFMCCFVHLGYLHVFIREISNIMDAMYLDVSIFVALFFSKSF